MAYGSKTYVCFDADNDIKMYRLMQAWKENKNVAFNFHNAHEINNLKKESGDATIKKQLREKLKSTKVLIILIGDHTKNLYKYVRWEIDYAIENDIPIIGVNLNGVETLDGKLCPQLLKDKLALHVSYKQKIIDFALNNWPDSHFSLRKKNVVDWYYYRDKIYKDLGI